MVVSDLNSEFRIFFRGRFGVFGQFPNFFPRSIRSIRTIPNSFPSSFGVFGQFRTDFRIICGKNMEIPQNPLFFHENIVFLIRKSPNTPNSIFRANIRNLLLRGRDLESFKGGKFNTLSLVDCYVQICNGTAVEHGSLLNCSGVCDGINCCKSVIITK